MHPDKIGRYKIKEELGHGEMGAVYRAFNLNTGDSEVDDVTNNHIEILYKTQAALHGIQPGIVRIKWQTKNQVSRLTAIR